MSGKGNCDDNGIDELFFEKISAGLVWRRT
jgi:hypothetical protein